MNKQEKIELIKLLEEKAKREKANSLWMFKPYPWQDEFYQSGIEHKQRMLMAANRVGKTRSSCIELCYHLTGIYPDWWEGVVFKHPTNCWALGVSGEQIRDVLQNEVFGSLTSDGFDGNGLVPVRLIGEIVRSMTPKLAKDVKVKHATGGWSSISFKSYSQGQHVLMGSSVDYALIDEEPQDQEIYPQVLTRTSTGNRGQGGYTVLSFTPENGATPLVHQFINDIKPGQYLKNVTWDDAPHLTEETKIQLLAAIPEYQRDMRSKGLPLLGSGLIFPVSEELIKCDPIKIPEHWPRIKGIDFGYDHPSALACCAWDRDTDTWYVYDAYRKSYQNTQINPVSDFSHAINSRLKWIPVSWPHDGLQHDKGSGEQIAKQYRDNDVNLLGRRATFSDGSNGVEAGILEMLNRMQDGRFKVFSHLTQWFEEFRLYHRKDGKINKINDDLISATRYALMMRRYAEVNIEDDYEYQPRNNNQVMGY